MTLYIHIVWFADSPPKFDMQTNMWGWLTFPGSNIYTQDATTGNNIYTSESDLRTPIIKDYGFVV